MPINRTPAPYNTPRQMLLAAALTAVLLACASCSSTKSATDSQQQASATAQPATDSAKQYSTANFSVQASGITANGQMRMLQDSILWVCASKIVELGRAKITPDSVIVYAKIMNKCFCGTYEDVYERFHWRTDFQQITQMVTAADAAQQIAALATLFGISATITIEPWRQVESTTFPLYMPNYVQHL